MRLMWNCYVGCCLLCAACYAVENIYISEGIDHSIDVRELLGGSNMVAAVALVPVMLFQGHTVSPQWMMSAAGWAILGISVSSTLAYMMFFYTIKVAGPVFASPWQACRDAYLNTPHGAPMTLPAAGEQGRQRG